MTLPNGQPIPPGLIDHINSWGEPDQITPGWLERLPGVIERLARKWDITFDEFTPESYITLVLLGHSTKLGPVVFKSSPLADEFRSESTALRLAGGEHVSHLLDLDAEHSAMIVERIIPGTQLRQAGLSDEEATGIMARAALDMWRVPDDPSGLIPLEPWMRALFNWKSRPEQIPDEYIDLAHSMGRRLLDERVPPQLLHGDLQHHNLLLRESGDWAIIDPKGIWGDPGFEIAAWMYNPPKVQDQPDYAELAPRRIAQVADIWQMPERRLTEWAFVGAVLSAVWSASEFTMDDWSSGALKVARQMRAMLER